MNKKRNKRKTKKPFYKRRGIYLFFLVCFLLGILAILLFDQLYLKEFRDRALTNYDYDKVDDVEIPSQIFDRNGALIGRSYDENRSLVTIDKIPSVFINALLAQEDQRFWEHNGVDWVGVLRAVYLNLKAGETTQGASTITMQLARNAFDLQKEADERGESGIERKIVESFVALEIEKHYVGKVDTEKRLTNKRKLLEMYLNRVHFGKGYYGIRAAALGFFGKEPEDLSISESASLVACIKNPFFINPVRNPERNQKDRNHVFTRMFAEGTIPTREEYERLTAAPVVTNPRPLRRGTSHLYDKVVALTRDIVGDDAMSRGGFSIYTTVDKDVQEAANQSLREQLLEIEQTEGYKHPLLSEHNRESLKAPVYLQGAVLVTDTTTGAVIAHVGGREFLHSQYDFIESGRRPIGTAFLPVVYAAAFEKGRSPATLVDDLPIDAREVALGGSEGILGEWGNEILDPVYEGEVTARKALRDSKIAATVRLGVDVGIATVADQAKKFGLPLESGEMLARLLLGWEQNSLWQVSRMYSSFARNGQAPKNLYYIESIKNIDGEEVYRAPRSKSETVELCSSASAFQLHSILADTTHHGNLRDESGVLVEHDLAVCKTGTTHNFSDSWSLGYNGDVTCGVWVGFLEGRKPIHDFAFARTVAFPIWANTMNVAANHFPGQRLKMPPTLSAVALCESSGRKVTRYCYDSVFDAELGVSLASTSYPEYLRVGKAEVGLCPVHGTGGVTPSDEFGPSTEELRQRRLSVTPIQVLATALLGDDPYGAKTPTPAKVEEETAEDKDDQNDSPVSKKASFVAKETRKGEREATIKLRPPPRIPISDES
jgi:penicillin-binding protein 1A